MASSCFVAILLLDFVWGCCLSSLSLLEVLVALLPIDTVPENGRLRVLYYRDNNYIWIQANAGGKKWRLNHIFDIRSGKAPSYRRYRGLCGNSSPEFGRALQVLKDIKRRGTIDTDHWHEVVLVGHRFERVPS
jgi:hypothetical protein